MKAEIILRAEFFWTKRWALFSALTFAASRPFDNGRGHKCLRNCDLEKNFLWNVATDRDCADFWKEISWVIQQITEKCGVLSVARNEFLWKWNRRAVGNANEVVSIARGILIACKIFIENDEIFIYFLATAQIEANWLHLTLIWRRGRVLQKCWSSVQILAETAHHSMSYD